MPGQFLHGVEVIQIDNGTRPISTVKSSVIGMVGTAPDADAVKFPLNAPVLIAGSRLEAAALGSSGTLPMGIDGVFDQAGAFVVVVRVEEGADAAETLANVIGGVSAGGDYEGLQALLAAEDQTGVTPRLIVCPGFSHEEACATEMISIADTLRGMGIADGPNTTDADAIAYRNNFDSKRLYIVDPQAKVFNTDTAQNEDQPASARVAGLIAKTDNEKGFWHSPSNQPLLGIVGAGRPVPFALGNPNTRANLLNENEVTTIIQHNGRRLWGNRTTSSDPLWAFLSVVRTVDLINDSILRGHLWAVDKPITKALLEDLVEGVNAYLRELVGLGALLGGKAWIDPELNTKDTLKAGKVYIDFDLTPPTPAEHITFRSHLVDSYFVDVLPTAA